VTNGVGAGRVEELGDIVRGTGKFLRSLQP
jgi:hypothetical protein